MTPTAGWKGTSSDISRRSRRRWKPRLELATAIFEYLEIFPPVQALRARHAEHRGLSQHGPCIIMASDRCRHNRTGVTPIDPLLPPASLVRVLPLGIAGTLGILGGLGAFTFGYGDGAAYLMNDPAACANCHVMQGHYDSWLQSSHGRVATCNDCHLPHDFAGKWITKADNGFFHSLAFTTNVFHEPIRIKPRNRRVTQGTCLHCHDDLVGHMRPAEPGGDMLLCIHCHDDVGHSQR